jgi:site-specific recombinase XerD
VTTIREALAEYEQYRLGRGAVSPNTVRGERPGLQQFVDALDGRSLSDWRWLTREDLEAWWDDLLQGPLSPATRELRLSQVRSFLGWARTMNYINYDPTALIHAHVPAKAARNRLSAAQLLGLLDLAAYPGDRAVLAVAANLGLRGGEIARLRIGDYNQATGTLRVHVDKTNQVDDMPVSADLARELDIWLRHYLDVCREAGKTAYLFPAKHVSHHKGTITYRPDSPVGKPFLIAQRALQAALDTGLISPDQWGDQAEDQVDDDGAVLAGREGIHTIRRSIARIYFDDILASGGESEALLATMALLHHSKTETTLRYIGYDRQVEARDQHLRGKAFLTRMVQPVAPVVPLRVVSA